ncbi:TetR family transcriptional regulator [Piscinibacter gummiphilus]|uniref:TetR family transcriptional regulator n=1 Tax=Piscinibacter gummiphilus TaxID=946333 RepID=A0A1W6L358_9BURK|nr:TetR family transcriptional regulator [Piscinibacter gummiphilus]ARN18702.1 TetR family transcriptional regulator [Piscinibacter gummiphilus]ATU63339.1 TetR family transcriptional regulator [Piscinibacter gummiphilus]GLS95849.1 TetR family transcriptional regulator [Piscinibacter gummiphilus]
MTQLKQGKPVRGTGVREAAAQATRDSILRAATKVFARYGYDGGSVEKISQTAKTYDRMIYYYFGNKEGLFIAVLEDIYQRMDDAEAKFAPDPSDPVEALKTVVRFKVAYYRKNPDFITLLNTENLHKGKHVSKSPRAREFSAQAVTLIADILAVGAERGLFRSDLDARDVYLLIVSMSYFYTSNRYTMSAFLGEALDGAEAVARWEAVVIDCILRTVRVDAPSR